MCHQLWHHLQTSGPGKPREVGLQRACSGADASGLRCLGGLRRLLHPARQRRTERRTEEVPCAPTLPLLLSVPRLLLRKKVLELPFALRTDILLEEDCARAIMNLEGIGVIRRKRLALVALIGGGHCLPPLLRKPSRCVRQETLRMKHRRSWVSCAIAEKTGLSETPRPPTGRGVALIFPANGRTSVFRKERLAATRHTRQRP